MSQRWPKRYFGLFLALLALFQLQAAELHCRYKLQNLKLLVSIGSPHPNIPFVELNLMGKSGLSGKEIDAIIGKDPSLWPTIGRVYRYIAKVRYDPKTDEAKFGSQPRNTQRGHCPHPKEKRFLTTDFTNKSGEEMRHDFPNPHPCYP